MIKQKKMIGKLNMQEIENHLKEQVVVRIGCYAGNQVYMVPVSYAYNGKYIYVRSFEGKKNGDDEEKS